MSNDGRICDWTNALGSAGNPRSSESQDDSEISVFHSHHLLSSPCFVFFLKQQNDKQTKDVKVRVGGKRKYMLCQMNILLGQNVFHK